MTSPQATSLAHDLRAILRALRRRFREHAPLGEFTPSQKAVLNRLEQHGPATNSALARAEGMRPQSMAAITTALECSGNIQGTPDPQDGRQTLLSLTDAYRKDLQSGRDARQDWLERSIEAHLTPQEQDLLAQATQLLRRIAGA